MKYFNIRLLSGNGLCKSVASFLLRPFSVWDGTFFACDLKKDEENMERFELDWRLHFLKWKIHFQNRPQEDVQKLERAIRVSGHQQPVRTKGGLLIAPVERNVMTDDFRQYHTLYDSLFRFTEEHKWHTEWVLEAGEKGGTRPSTNPRSNRGGARIFCGLSGARLVPVVTNTGKQNIGRIHARFVVPVGLHEVEFVYKPGSVEGGFIAAGFVRKHTIKSDDEGHYMETEDIWLWEGLLNKVQLPPANFVAAFEAAKAKALTPDCDRPFYVA